MGIAVLIGLGAAFTAFTALVFSVLTILMGKVFKSFEISGPDDWSFGDFYLRYLIIAAVFTLVTLPLGYGLLGIGALAIAYKYVFDAGWTQAAIMGIGGGIISFVLFAVLFNVVFTSLGWIG
jgi:hypothetical protein